MCVAGKYHDSGGDGGEQTEAHQPERDEGADERGVELQDRDDDEPAEDRHRKVQPDDECFEASVGRAVHTDGSRRGR